MAHNHGNEYQVKIVHEDRTEELSGWMNGEEQVAQVVAAVRRPPGTTFWLRARNVLCPNCRDSEQRIIVECPLTDVPSQRCSPHDSYYLVAAGLKNRHAVFSQNFHR